MVEKGRAVWTCYEKTGIDCLECGSVDRIVAGNESVVRDILAQMPADVCGK